MAYVEDSQIHSFHADLSMLFHTGLFDAYVASLGGWSQHDQSRTLMYPLSNLLLLSSPDQLQTSIVQVCFVSSFRRVSKFPHRDFACFILSMFLVILFCVTIICKFFSSLVSTNQLFVHMKNFNLCMLIFYITTLLNVIFVSILTNLL